MSTPTIQKDTAEAIIAHAADGLAPFLALCRKMLATERPEVYAEATRAVNAAGLKAMAEQYSHLASLSRPKLFAEILSRMTQKEFAQYRDVAASLPESELIQDAMRLEFRRRQGFWTASVANMT